MKVLSVSLVSTGVTTKDQILQFGMVLFDTNGDIAIKDAPSLAGYVLQPRVEGAPATLIECAEALRVISGILPPAPDHIVTDMKQLSGGVYLGEDGEIAGTNNPVIDFIYKNVQLTRTGDRPILLGVDPARMIVPLLPPSILSILQPATIDLSSMCIVFDDVVPPSIITCLTRSAVEDVETMSPVQKARAQLVTFYERAGV